MSNIILQIMAVWVYSTKKSDNTKYCTICTSNILTSSVYFHTWSRRVNVFLLKKYYCKKNILNIQLKILYTKFKENNKMLINYQYSKYNYHCTCMLLCATVLVYILISSFVSDSNGILLLIHNTTTLYWSKKSELCTISSLHNMILRRSERTFKW